MDVWVGFERLVARHQGNIGWTAAAQVVRDIDGPAVPTGCGGGRWKALQRNPEARIPRFAPCIGHRKRRQGRRDTRGTRMSVVYRSVFLPCSVALRPHVGVRHEPPCAVRATIFGVYRCDIRSLQQKPGGQWRWRSAKGARRGRMRLPAACCVGCETQGRPGRSDSRLALYESSGDRRRLNPADRSRRGA